MTKFNIRLLTFSRKLFLSVITLFIAFAACFMLFQYQREKSYKTELLNTQLQNYNEQMYGYMADAGSLDSLKHYIMTHMIPNLRVTIITPEGKVIFDSTDKNLSEFSNHSSRKEVQDALMYGSGYAISRFSERIDGEEYLYSAKYFTKRRIILRTFPKNEVGEISQHIITIYKRLHRAKEALYIEREKLISHLQTSHEGLGVFTKERKEILVNSLFTQYINNISDRNLSSTDEIFTIPELKPIIEFLNKNEGNYSKEEKRVTHHLNKNARTFTIECIIFQDLSFEISINDITQEEEQARLKRQLTQNIAHELKTPVSSIQGYLETILSNPNIPKDTVRTFLERSYAQSNRLTTLLRDISVLTRMDEAPEMMEREAVNLSLVVDNIINEVALGLEEKCIRVINLMPQALMVNGNHSLLYSIFRNLMDNAIAYAGTNIQITINCFREDDTFYYFSFSDSGVGVEEEHLTRLFERFYRVDKGRSRKLGGTGLGLAIVKNAVLFHGGTIFAKNAPNGGLVFVFTLQK